MREGCERLATTLEGLALPFREPDAVKEAMRRLLDAGATVLPSPGSGHTRDRWLALTVVGATDLSLAKVYESHTDAIAILSELGETGNPRELHAVWAAGGPGDPLVFDPGKGRLNGTKPWCSGASIVDQGLLTAVDLNGCSQLVLVDMGTAGISVEPANWASEAMKAAGTTRIQFEQVPVQPIGPTGAYLDRAGFWHGGAGIAAVWFGAAAAVAARMARGIGKRDDPHGWAHLGAVDAQLSAARALLLETADWIDASPSAPAFRKAMSVRAAVEFAAEEVLRRSARSLGPGPLCSESEHWQRCADLEIFLRQSHGERDLAALGDEIGERLDYGW